MTLVHVRTLCLMENAREVNTLTRACAPESVSFYLDSPLLAFSKHQTTPHSSMTNATVDFENKTNLKDIRLRVSFRKKNIIDKMLANINRKHFSAVGLVLLTEVFV